MIEENMLRGPVEEIEDEIRDLEERRTRALAEARDAGRRAGEIEARRREIGLAVFEGDALAATEDEGLRDELEDTGRLGALANAAASELAALIAPARVRLEHAEREAHALRYRELSEERYRLENEVDRLADALVRAIERVRPLDAEQREAGRAAGNSSYRPGSTLPAGFDRTISRWFWRRFGPSSWVLKNELGAGLDASNRLVDVDTLARIPEATNGDD